MSICKYNATGVSKFQMDYPHSFFGLLEFFFTKPLNTVSFLINVSPFSLVC